MILVGKLANVRYSTSIPSKAENTTPLVKWHSYSLKLVNSLSIKLAFKTTGALFITRSTVKEYYSDSFRGFHCRKDPANEMLTLLSCRAGIVCT